jgi:hypothetical protein
MDDLNLDTACSILCPVGTEQGVEPTQIWLGMALFIFSEILGGMNIEPTGIFSAVIHCFKRLARVPK